MPMTIEKNILELYRFGDFAGFEVLHRLIHRFEGVLGNLKRRNENPRGKNDAAIVHFLHVVVLVLRPAQSHSIFRVHLRIVYQCSGWHFIHLRGISHKNNTMKLATVQAIARIRVAIICAY